MGKIRRIVSGLATALLFSAVLAAPSRADFVPPSPSTGCDHDLQTFTPSRTSPQWGVDSHGEPVDVVQFYIHGELLNLATAFQGEGWVEALPKDWTGAVAYAVGGLGLGIPWIVERMPMSIETLCGETMIDSWEKNNDPLGGRDHFRVFSAGDDLQGRPVWAISASLDTGLRVDPNRPEQAFVNHASEANEDLERDRVLQDLIHSQQVTSLRTLHLKPTGYAQDNGAYSGDGKVYELVIH